MQLPELHFMNLNNTDMHLSRWGDILAQFLLAWFATAAAMALPAIIAGFCLGVLISTTVAASAMYRASLLPLSFGTIFGLALRYYPAAVRSTISGLQIVAPIFLFLCILVRLLWDAHKRRRNAPTVN